MHDLAPAVKSRRTKTLAAVGGVLGTTDAAKRSAYEVGPNTSPTATTDLRQQLGNQAHSKKKPAQVNQCGFFMAAGSAAAL